MDDEVARESECGQHDASLRECNLRLITQEQLRTLTEVTELTSLDLSHNELADVPDLGSLSALRTLDLSRNWFKELPLSAIEPLRLLESLDISRNFLRPSTVKAALPILQGLVALRRLDLRFNPKCARQVIHCRACARVCSGCRRLLTRSAHTRRLPRPQDLMDTLRLELPAIPCHAKGAKTDGLRMTVSRDREVGDRPQKGTRHQHHTH
jgi:Leucine-rich repeat (LRR) protein